MGNICRSPTAEGVFRQLVTEQGIADEFEIDSAGTHNYHSGNPSDKHSQIQALKYGIDISQLTARQVHSYDFEYYDYILAMDHQNISYLMVQCPEVYQHKIQLFLKYSPEAPVTEVPDPYDGHDNQGFETVLQLCKQASMGLLAKLKA